MPDDYTVSASCGIVEWWGISGQSPKSQSKVFPLNSDILFLSFIINDLKILSHNFHTTSLVWIGSSVNQMLTRTYATQHFSVILV